MEHAGNSGIQQIRKLQSRFVVAHDDHPAILYTGVTGLSRCRMVSKRLIRAIAGPRTPVACVHVSDSGLEFLWGEDANEGAAALRRLSAELIGLLSVLDWAAGDKSGGGSGPFAWRYAELSCVLAIATMTKSLRSAGYPDGLPALFEGRPTVGEQGVELILPGQFMAVPIRLDDVWLEVLEDVRAGKVEVAILPYPLDAGARIVRMLGRYAFGEAFEGDGGQDEPGGSGGEIVAAKQNQAEKWGGGTVKQRIERFLEKHRETINQRRPLWRQGVRGAIVEDQARFGATAVAREIGCSKQAISLEAAWITELGQYLNPKTQARLGNMAAPEMADVVQDLASRIERTKARRGASDGK